MIKPLFDNVVLKKEKISSTTTSGIVLSSKEEESKYGVVVAVGNGIKPDGSKIDMPLKVGNKVFFKSYSSDTFQEDNEEYLIVSLSNIIGIIE